MWNYLKLRLLLSAVIFGLIDYAGASTKDTYTGARLGHRIVQTRYGRLHGLILPLDNFRLLRSVEVFLGVPYATPPTKQNRFVLYNFSLILLRHGIINGINLQVQSNTCTGSLGRYSYLRYLQSSVSATFAEHSK